MAAVEVSVIALEQSGIVPAAGGTCVDGRKEGKESEEGGVKQFNRGASNGPF
jgi:hypothetical protein